jgi:protein phosphatase
MRIIPGNAQAIGDRENQQDAFGFSDFGDHAFKLHGGILMVLCDGMGGLANGAAASLAAVDAVIAGYQRKQPSEDIPSALDRAILEAHRAVCAVSGDSGAAGTTVVAAVVWQDRLYWDSLGDSRLYLCRGGAPAVQLTEDHNVATMLDQRVRRGESSRKEAAAAKDREALTAYLGAPRMPQPYAGRDGLPLQPGDRIVACSDGLYRGLTPEAIGSIGRAAEPMKVAEQLVQAVLRQKLPHQDNITVALLEVSPARGLIDLPSLTLPGIDLPGWVTRHTVLAGALGFAAATALTGVLLAFGALSIGGGGRKAATPVAVVPAGPDIVAQPAAPPAAPPGPSPAPPAPAAQAGQEAPPVPQAAGTEERVPIPSNFLNPPSQPAERPADATNKAPPPKRPVPASAAHPMPNESSGGRDAQGTTPPKPPPANGAGAATQTPATSPAPATPNAVGPPSGGSMP